MSVSKFYLSEKLIEGYVKTPPSLKEQTLTKLAIYLCQFFQLKNEIICASNNLKAEIHIDLGEAWQELVETQSKAVSEKFSLPPTLSSALIACIRLIALELLNWNKQHQVIFHTSANVTDQFLKLNDWTIEGRLNEAKIAERLVQDENISVCGRYRLACIYSLEPYILPLWDQTTLEQREKFCTFTNLGNCKRSGLVELKSYQLAGKLQEVVDDENTLWKIQLRIAVEEGARTAFVNFWKVLKENQKQEIIIPIALYVIAQSDATKYLSISSQALWMMALLQECYLKQPVRPAHYSDILYFLISQMSHEEMISFFRQAIQANRQKISKNTVNDCLFIWFLQWPYQEFFIPVITKLWGVLTEDRYAQILLMLVERSSNLTDICMREDQDYPFGDLFINLVELTPEQYNIFNVTIPKLGTTWGMTILLKLVDKKSPHKPTDKNIFQKFLQQVTTAEKNSIMNSQHGRKFMSIMGAFTVE